MSELPSGWEYRRVDQVGDVQLGRQRSPSLMTGRYITPYLRVANVLDGYIDYSDVLKMNFNPQEAATFRLQSGDILLNEGQELDLVGRCAIFDGAPGMCFQNTLIRFRPQFVLSRFAAAVFKYWLDSGKFRMVARQTTSIAHLGASQFSAMLFPFAPMKEQQRIVEVLDSVDACVRARQAMIDKVALTSGQVVDAFLSEFSVNGSVLGVERTALESMAATDRPILKTGPFGSSLKGDDWVEQGVPVVTIGSLRDGYISEDELLYISAEKATTLFGYRLLEGDIVFSRVADVGRSAVVRSMQSGWIMSSNLMRIAVDLKVVIPDYLQLVIAHYHPLREQIRKLTNGSGREVVNDAIMRQLEFPLIPVAAQQKMLDMVGRFRGVIEVEERALAKLGLLKQGLMDDLLTGRSRVTPVSL